MANVTFFYFGDDEAYFRALVGEFAKSTRMIVDFKRFYETDEKKIQSFFLKVFREKPGAIFIDFSKNTQDYLHLARIITRSHMEHTLVTVGLVDYLSPPEVLTESISTGVTLTHIKSAETFDIAFDVCKLVAPNDVGEHGFANATLKDEYEAGIPAKVGYIHGEGLHIETDVHLQKGDRIRLNHHWTQKRIVPSREVFVREISTKNVFYNFKYGVDLDFQFVDEFHPPEGMDPEIIKEKTEERVDLIEYYKRQSARWISENASRSYEKKAKVLIVDRQFHFYNDQPRTDKHDYIIRCTPYLEDPGPELDKLQPQVIAFSMDKEDEPESKNTNEQLVRLMKTIKGKFQDTKPFVVVFNCKVASKSLQDQFDYPHVITSDGELSVDVLVRMADIFDKKLSKALPVMNNKTEKVFLKKTNIASIAEIVIPITIIKISETDLIFQTDRELQIGMNLHVKSPVDMYIHVQPAKGQPKVPEYYGLIHCMGEEEKKTLRKFVNTVFFRDHDAQVQADTDEFKKLNETKLKERLEAQKKADEASGGSESKSQSPSETKP